MDNLTDPGGTSSNALEGFAEGVAERVTGGGDRHIVQLLPDHYPREPSPPKVWKDEEALDEWKRGLPDRDTVIVLHVVNAPGDSEPFENEVRSPNSNRPN